MNYSTLKLMIFTILCLLFVAAIAMYLWYAYKPSVAVEYFGIVKAREVEPAHTEKGYNFSTSFHARQSGLSTTEKYIPQGNKYTLELEDGSIETLSYDQSYDAFREPTANVGDRVKLTKRTKWMPFFGNTLTSQKLEKIK